jgi:hypothetical protein
MGHRTDRGGYRSTRITSATTTTVKAGAGIVLGFYVEVALAGIVTFNDSTGAKLILPAAIPVGFHALDIGFAGKIEVVTAGTDRIVIIWD